MSSILSETFFWSTERLILKIMTLHFRFMTFVSASSLIPFSFHLCLSWRERPPPSLVFWKPLSTLWVHNGFWLLPYISFLKRQCSGKLSQFSSSSSFFKLLSILSFLSAPFAPSWYSKFDGLVALVLIYLSISTERLFLGVGWGESWSCQDF